MGENSKIEWTHHTFNPWRGCTKVSTGCTNCYAETLSKRNPKVLGVWGPDGTRVVASEKMWQEPVRWNAEAAAAGERLRVFCASLADVFEDRAELAPWRARLFRLIDSTPSLDWLLLTKRPENIGRMWHTESYIENGKNWGDSKPTSRRFRRSNVWLGTSVEDQPAADRRVPELLRCADLAQVLFLSMEPLLGPVNLSRWLDASRGAGKRTHAWLQWVIVGGESGARRPPGSGGARSMDLAWVRSLVEECRAAEVAVFVKQLGTNPEEALRAGELGGGIPFEDGMYGRWTRDPKGGDPTEWPDSLRVRQMPAPREAAR